MGVEDALGEPGGPRRVVELRRVVGGGVHGVEVIVGVGQEALVEHQHLIDQIARHPVRLVGRADDQLRPGVLDSMADPLVAIEHRHREQDRAQLPGAEEDRRRLRRRRGDHRNPVAALHAVSSQHVCGPGGERLQLAPAHPALVAAEVLPDHRRLVAGMLVADVGGDVVAVGDAPAVRGTRVLIGAEPRLRLGRRHRLSSVLIRSRLCIVSYPDGTPCKLPSSGSTGDMRSAEAPSPPDSLPPIIGLPGRVAQWESARFTRERSLVRNQPRPFRARLPSVQQRAYAVDVRSVSAAQRLPIDARSN